MKRTVLSIAASVLVLGAAAAAQAADVEAGKTVFKKCAVCHSIEPGVNKVGPSLAGVVGRKAGTLAGFNYSSAMKDSGVTWNAETLNTYLAAPMQVVKGTKMAFPGVKEDTDRANVIAYLETLK